MFQQNQARPLAISQPLGLDDFIQNQVRRFAVGTGRPTWRHPESGVLTMAKRPNMRAMREVEAEVLEILDGAGSDEACTVDMIRNTLGTKVRHDFLDKALARLEAKGEIDAGYSVNDNVQLNHMTKDIESYYAIGARRRTATEVLTSLSVKGMIARSYLRSSRAAATATAESIGAAAALAAPAPIAAPAALAAGAAGFCDVKSALRALDAEAPGQGWHVEQVHQKLVEMGCNRDEGEVARELFDEAMLKIPRGALTDSTGLLFRINPNNPN